MSGMNPVILIQLMQQYHDYKAEPRTFAFTKNYLKRVHRETAEETARRKSLLSPQIRQYAEETLKDKLRNTLKGRVGRVWIDPEMAKIAVPLEMATGQTGYGILPTGSRVKIPDSKVVRAFVYWEKVNDIDLSCFAVDGDGNRREFSWRTMWGQQSPAVTFSGDQTNGYNGGSEYFDINLKLLKAMYPEFRRIIFCANIFSGSGSIHYNGVECTAGFMLREKISSGEVYEPKTVKSSFRVTSDSSFAYLFGIDLETLEMVWLNMTRAGDHAIAGESDRFGWLDRYFSSTDVMNVQKLYQWAGTPVDKYTDADVLVTDRFGPAETFYGKPVVRSCDFEKILQVLTKEGGAA